jgi:uncharacterized membrane protein
MIERTIQKMKNDHSRVWVVASALVAYAILEVTWLSTMRNFYVRMLGTYGYRGVLQSVSAAVVVYLLLAVALAFFVILPSRGDPSPVHSIARGALFGASIYGTYNLTNASTLPNYSWTMVAVDTLWGTASCAAVGGVANLLSIALQRMTNAPPPRG